MVEIKFIVEKLPLTCEHCPMVKNRVAHENESITGSYYYCRLTGRSLYWHEFHTAREDKCPLEVESEDE